MKTALPVILTVLLFLSACSQSGNKESSGNKPGDTNQGQSAGQATGRFKPEKSGEVVARVNGVPIYKDELNGVPVDELVTDEILYQEGLSEGLDKKFQDKVLQYQETLVMREVKGNILTSLPPQKEISEQDMLNYYNEAKDINYTNLRVEEINFTDKKLGDQIIKMARDGKDFDDIAKELQGGGSEVKVDQLGYDRRLNGYFDVKEVGAISNVFDKKDGTYSVLRIEEVKVIPFENVKKSIQYILEGRRKGEAYKEYAQKIAKEKNYKIEIVKPQNQ